MQSTQTTEEPQKAPEDQAQEGWVAAVDATTLAEKGRMLFRREGKQIALFWQAGEVYALDNRCPHEGYPLKEGTVKSAEGEVSVLTCQWHNWKFDMKSGVCLLGADHVRSYATEVRAGVVWLDLRAPAPAAQEAKILAGLKTGVEKRQFGRINREIARLIAAGLDPVVALQQALIWRSEHFEFGMTHAHAVSADWLALYDQSEGDTARQISCLAEAIDHIADDTLRHPRYAFTEEIQEFDGHAFLAAVEDEDEEQAIALCRGALAAGMGWTGLEPWLARAALDHYNDFGHSMIYVQKSGELVARLGEDITPSLVLPLVRSLCVATREDLLPAFRRYAEFVAALPEVPEKLEAQPIPETAAEAVYTASINQAMAWVSEQRLRYAPAAIFDVLLASCAQTLLYYDTSYQDATDRPVAQNIGWLHVTHALTFAHAVRTICERYPALWPPGLLQMACFSGRHQAYLNRALETAQWSVKADEEAAFFTAQLNKICDHGIQGPIFSAHLLKTCLAVREEVARLSEVASAAAIREDLLRSLHRFLSSPLKQKHVRREAEQAIALVG